MPKTTKRGGARERKTWTGKWGVWDIERRCLYVPCLFKRKEWAEAERESLLLHFAPNNPWRRRLDVREVDAGARVGRASAGSPSPSG